MYLAFKEKMNSLTESSFEKQRLFDRIQVYAVAAFWVLFTGFLLYLGNEKENGQKGYRPMSEMGTVQPRESRSLELNSMNKRLP